MPEGTRQRLAFDRFWALGATRSLARLHADWVADAAPGERVPALRTIERWSARFGWTARLATQETAARRVADQAREEASREMYQRQARVGVWLQQRGAAWLQELADDGASARDAIRAVVDGAKLERIARGEPGDRSIVEGPDDDHGPFADFSAEQLVALAEAGAELLARRGDQESQ
jgi:hypothetical protein